ncbi:hypothetical protein [Crenalkalicoccus roseus]|uniref:hypothetical protein n=1 Tax=Crenalkalicoccus roseus TaxID=1485588 RepID=UPI0010806757|nr:hypothetical protein [Crenalkalicoccus roseus]
MANARDPRDPLDPAAPRDPAMPTDPTLHPDTAARPTVGPATAGSPPPIRRRAGGWGWAIGALVVLLLVAWFAWDGNLGQRDTVAGADRQPVAGETMPRADIPADRGGMTAAPGDTATGTGVGTPPGAGGGPAGTAAAPPAGTTGPGTAGAGIGPAPGATDPAPATGTTAPPAPAESPATR